MAHRCSRLQNMLAFMKIGLPGSEITYYSLTNRDFIFLVPMQESHLASAETLL